MRKFSLKNLRSKYFGFLFIFAFFVLGFFSWRNFFSPALVVSEVTDGDTIKLNDGRRVRYIGIDAPEEETCFAEEATEINQELVLGKEVRLERDLNEMDQFGRYLAYVYVVEGDEEFFVNQTLLTEGAGEFFLDTINLKYQEALVQAAEEAHEKKKGLWQVCGPCLIKGNVDRLDKRWYHLPSFRHYDQVVVNLGHGDQWFCSEEEAQEAGFERARE
ncbi:MAG: thermonuclease family protein [Candidatus Marinimicrobia bacterium]|nr:thermonuclease family protein [Candidatus Neomarinimicrobiota bacterium]